MRISADLSRCEGHGLCVEAAPEVFDLDDDAVVVVTRAVVPPEFVRKAESAARLCPVAALHLEA
ncbi:ferredoxin [Nocardia sp. NBC_01730]|uniref:ferredoxin n=1 Tax=Nocardia sp. NBC_01730 TaxID=2975998 RepID=UPI002E14F716|nr:ferredoxin [Nocardia sp. NBC_01730]